MTELVYNLSEGSDEKPSIMKMNEEVIVGQELLVCLAKLVAFSTGRITWNLRYKFKHKRELRNQFEKLYPNADSKPDTNIKELSDSNEKELKGSLKIILRIVNQKMFVRSKKILSKLIIFLMISEMK